MITKMLQVYLYQHKWACAKIYVYALGDNFNFYLNTDEKWCGMLYPLGIIVKRNDISSIMPIKRIITLCNIADSVTSHVCDFVIFSIRLFTFFNVFLLFIFIFIFTPSTLLHN